MASRILLVEDEEHLLQGIKLNLELEGYNVTPCSDGKKALDIFRSAHFDMVILDVMLPGADGFEICQIIRLTHKDIPILFLTAKGSSTDRIQGLKIGADDYLTKPFELEELLLRVRKLLRRILGHSGKPGMEVFRFGGNEINFNSYKILGVKGKAVELSQREIHLLQLLIERKGEVVSREEILRIVWGVDVYPSTRTIDNYIVSFRKYFEKNPRQPRHFHSIRGVGYKFEE